MSSTSTYVNITFKPPGARMPSGDLVPRHTLAMVVESRSCTITLVETPRQLQRFLEEALSAVARQRRLVEE